MANTSYALNYKDFIKKLNKFKVNMSGFEKIKLPEPDLFFADKNWSKIETQFSVKLSEKNFNYFKTKFNIDQKGKFVYDNVKFNFLKSNKKSSNINALGKGLADAGEKATIKAILAYTKNKTLNSPKDTGEKIFMENPDAFMAWKKSFDRTPEILDDIVKDSLSKYNIYHDATTNPFEKNVKGIISLRGGSKDSWNPADIWVIKKDQEKNINKEFDIIFKSELDKKAKLNAANAYIVKLYNDGYFYPISLKQITGLGQTELNNLKKNASPFYKFKFDDFPHDFQFDDTKNSFKTKEIGTFSATNIDNGKNLVFQVRAFPHRYGTVQTEITSSGEKTGGRVGKVPADIIDSVFSSYNDSRIKKISELKNLNFTDSDIKKFDKMYKSVSGGDSYFSDNIKTWLAMARVDEKIKTDLAIKLQGLVFSNFFKNNIKDTSIILNALLLGAKKISDTSGFFIKIY